MKGHPKPVKEYRLILQDIADPLIRLSWPPTPEKIVKASITPLRESAVDVYAYGILHAGGCTQCSEIYPVIGDDQPFLKSASALRINLAVKKLCDEGKDPVQIMCEGAHKIGMDFFLRLRMNDIHDRVGDNIGLDKPTITSKIRSPHPYFYTPKWKRDHPEWLIGNPEIKTDDTSRWWEAKAGNYANPQFRKLMYDSAIESIKKYDIDGLELDFMRHPYLFPRQEAYSQRNIMTKLISNIRSYIDKKGRNKSMYLSSRTPDTIESSLRIGLDIKTWFDEDLLDMVVISGGYHPFSTPWQDVGKIAKDSNVPAFACLNWGPAVGTKLNPKLEINKVKERLYAIAYRALKAGMQGFELFNFFYAMEYYYRPGEPRLGYGFTHEITDKAFLERTFKTYYLQHQHSVQSEKIYGHAAWKGHVPKQIAISLDGIGHVSIFEIADDLNKFPHATVKLHVELVDIGPEDKIEFFWNDNAIEPIPTAFPGIEIFDVNEFEFNLKPRNVRCGNNKLEIRLLQRDKHLEPFITLTNSFLTINTTSTNNKKN